MKISSVYLIFLVNFLLLFFSSCRDEMDLGDHYFYMPKYEVIDIGYPEGAIIYKSSEKNLYQHIILENEVLEAKSNENFIIAIQNKREFNPMEKGENLNNVDQFKYYIIDKHKDRLFGPFTKENFFEKRKELNIPDNLKLKLLEKIK